MDQGTRIVAKMDSQHQWQGEPFYVAGDKGTCTGVSKESADRVLVQVQFDDGPNKVKAGLWLVPLEDLLVDSLPDGTDELPQPTEEDEERGPRVLLKKSSPTLPVQQLKVHEVVVKDGDYVHPKERKKKYKPREQKAPVTERRAVVPPLTTFKEGQFKRVTVVDSEGQFAVVVGAPPVIRIEKEPVDVPAEVEFTKEPPPPLEFRGRERRVLQGKFSPDVQELANLWVGESLFFECESDRGTNTATALLNQCKVSGHLKGMKFSARSYTAIDAMAPLGVVTILVKITRTA